MLKINEVTAWKTVVIPHKENPLKICTDMKYLITGFPCDSNGNMLILLNEYKTDPEPGFGLMTYVLTKDELKNNFDIIKIL